MPNPEIVLQELVVSSGWLTGNENIRGISQRFRLLTKKQSLALKPRHCLLNSTPTSAAPPPLSHLRFHLKMPSTNRPLCLWAAPRTVSTAFDKMMRERQDHKVFTEPFSYAWYFGPERLSPRYSLEYPCKTFSSVLASIRKTTRPPSSLPVFVKEMPYQLGPLLRPDVLLSFHGSLLIRHPAWVLPSLHRMWPDFTDHETGYPALVSVLSMLRNAGESPAVIDSDDLRNNPEAVVGQWCDAVGIERRPDALNWQPGMPDDWVLWRPWFERAAQSTCFLPPDHRGPPPVDERLARRIDAVRPLFRQLEVHKVHVA